MKKIKIKSYHGAGWLAEYKYYINTTYLYCENQYIHSVSSYEREEIY